MCNERLIPKMMGGNEGEVFDSRLIVRVDMFMLIDGCSVSSYLHISYLVSYRKVKWPGIYVSRYEGLLCCTGLEGRKEKLVYRTLNFP